MPMTIQASLHSQTVSYDRDVFSAKCVYHITASDGSAITPEQIVTSSSVADVLNGSDGLDSLGTFIGGDVAFGGIAKVRYSGYTLQNEEGGFKWTVSVNFDSGASSYSPSTEQKDIIPENQPGFTAIEMGFTSVVMPVWRVEPYTGSITYNDSFISNPAETDIAGTAVDRAGDPIDKQLAVVNITVRKVVGKRPSVAAGGSSDWDVIVSKINNRNSSSVTIGGFTALKNTLLFSGANVTRVGPNSYEVSYSFVYDPYYHLRQVANMDANHQPVVGVKLSSGAISTNDSDIASADAGHANKSAPRYAANVFWKQPFPTTSDLNPLLTGIT